uniref:Ig-like domain-containing protein n=1 Tax=Stegastes partitus TaxID=144197 RepID=A0A3B5ART8_9TELE
MAKFDCETEDAPNVSFKWFKDGHPIKEGDKYRIISRFSTSSLEVLSPSKDDSAEYTCKASNQHGSDECSASLSVTGKSDARFLLLRWLCLELFIQTSTAVWKQGSAARLQCTVKGSPELHTTWFFNNSELSAGGRYAISLKDGVATLEIQDVMLSDSGNYTCDVLNDSNFIAVLECEVSGSAPFDVTWKKNKKRLSADKKFRIVSQGSLSSLEIHSFESADVGEYECVVSNEVGSVTSKSGVKQKGSAPITVKWMKDSELLRDDDPNVKMAFENNITSISFSSVELKHGGKYTCLAENEAGQAQTAALRCTSLKQGRAMAACTPSRSLMWLAAVLVKHQLLF